MKIDGKILVEFSLELHMFPGRIFPSIFLALSGREKAMKISRKKVFSRSEFFHTFSAWKKVRKQREWKIFFSRCFLTSFRSRNSYENVRKIIIF